MAHHRPLILLLLSLRALAQLVCTSVGPPTSSGSISGSTVGNFTRIGMCSDIIVGAPLQVFLITAPAGLPTGAWGIISTCNDFTYFDTYVAVSRLPGGVAPCPATADEAARLGCDWSSDDAFGLCGLKSRVVVYNVLAGETLVVAVTGAPIPVSGQAGNFSYPSGAFMLTWDFSSVVGASATPSVAPTPPAYIEASQCVTPAATWTGSVPSNAFGLTELLTGTCNGVGFDGGSSQRLVRISLPPAPGGSPVQYGSLQLDTCNAGTLWDTTLVVAPRQPLGRPCDRTAFGDGVPACLSANDDAQLPCGPAGQVFGASRLVIPAQSNSSYVVLVSNSRPNSQAGLFTLSWSFSIVLPSPSSTQLYSFSSSPSLSSSASPSTSMLASTPNRTGTPLSTSTRTGTPQNTSTATSTVTQTVTSTPDPTGSKTPTPSQTGTTSATESHTVGVSDSITASASITATATGSDLTLGKKAEAAAIASSQKKVDRDTAIFAGFGGATLVGLVIVFMCLAWRAEVKSSLANPPRLVMQRIDSAASFEEGGEVGGEFGQENPLR